MDDQVMMIMTILNILSPVWFLNFLCHHTRASNEKEAIFTCSESKLSPPDLQTQPNDSEELVRSPGEVSHCSSPHSPGRRGFSLKLAKTTFSYFFTWQCCCQLWRQKRRAMMRREAKTRRCRSEIRTITHEILSNFVFLLLCLSLYLCLCLRWSSPSLIWLLRAMKYPALQFKTGSILTHLILVKSFPLHFSSLPQTSRAEPKILSKPHLNLVFFIVVIHTEVAGLHILHLK